jgi:hypothetical protein
MDLLGPTVPDGADRGDAVRLFRRNKRAPTDQQPQKFDPSSDEGIIGLYYSILGTADENFAKAVVDHLERLHEPGGYVREKRQHDFMDLGMKRVYLDALDDIELTVEDTISAPQVGIKKRGMAVVVARWRARGVHNRPLVGIPPSGEEVTIEGMSYTTFRNYNLRVEYSYWHMPELTRRVAER